MTDALQLQTVLRLQILGGAVLLGESGRPVASLTTRRTLALLAVVAVSRERGTSRDQLVGLLWPDTDEDHARHSLTQALYAARRALGVEDLFVGTSNLRLNRERISSDVDEFEAAIEADDPERAVALYRGPFLDGFFLSGGNHDVEQWMSAQRARYDGLMSQALERLIVRSEAGGDYTTALDARRRLAALRPLDAGVTVGLMRALAAAGHRASAIKLARTHELLLEQELGIAPDPAVSALVRQLGDDGFVAERMPAPTAHQAPHSSEAVPVASDREVHAATPARAPVDLRAFRTRRVRALAGALVLMGAAAALVWWVGSRPVVKPEVLNLGHRVAVAPFRVAGASQALEYLRLGSVELLAPRMADYQQQRALDRGGMVGAWVASGLRDAATVSQRQLIPLAQRMGAERIVIGSVVGSERHLVIEARMLAVPSGEPVAIAAASGPVDSVPSMMDHLASRLLLEEAGQSDRIGPRLPSNAAVRAYIAGERAARRHAYRAARLAFVEAVHRDSAFALAGLALAAISERLHDGATAQRGIAIAWRGRDNLRAADRRALLGLAGPRYPLPSSVAEQTSAWRAASRGSDAAGAWTTFATRVFHDGQTVHLTQWADTVRMALQMALAENHQDTAAAQLLMQVPDDSLPAPITFRLATTDSLDPVATFLRWRRAIAARDSVALTAFRAALGRTPIATLRLIALAEQHNGRATPDGEMAVREWLRRARDASEREEALEAYHALRLNQGRDPFALPRTPMPTGVADRDPGAQLRVRVLDAVYASVNGADAARAAEELGRRAQSADRGASVEIDGSLAADRCVHAQWRLARDNTTGVAAIIRWLREQPPVVGQPQYAAAPSACAILLQAWLDVVERRPTAHASVGYADSLALTPIVAGDAVTYAPLLIARLYARLGQHDAARRALRRRSYMTVWPRYLAAMAHEESRLSQ